MLRNMLCLVIVAFVCTGCISIHSEKRCTETKSECPKVCPKMLKHVVLFKFKEGTTPEKIKEVEQAFASLPGKISEIKCFEWGTNVSVENHSEGFTHCFVVTFANEAGLDAYMNNPDLKEFRKSLGGPLEKYIAIDYWTNH
jgi:quinol monooxygenase YgiN